MLRLIFFLVESFFLNKLDWYRCIDFIDNYCLFLLKIIKIYLFVVLGVMVVVLVLVGFKFLIVLFMVRYFNVSL